MQDYIAMVLVWYATEQHNAMTAELENENLSDKLNFIEKILDNQMKSQL